MDKNTVRAEVDAFRKRTATDRRVEDCFPAWYLAHQYGLSDTQALMQTSDPAIEGEAKGYDFGIDGFHLGLSENKHPKLVLIQAKFSEVLNAVSSGFRDLEKSLPKVAAALDGMGSDEPIENKVLLNLRRMIAQADEQIRKELNLEFVVIHLCDQDEMVVGANSRKSRDDLKEAFRDAFPDRNGTIGDVKSTPNELG